MKNTSLEGMLGLLRPLKLYSLKEDTLVYCELLSYAKGFSLLYGQLSELYREAFLPTAESFGLTVRERLMGFPVHEKLDAGVRRELLRRRMSLSPECCGLQGVTDSLKSIGLEALIREDPEGEMLFVTPKAFLGTFLSHDRLKRDALSMLPAHLEIKFLFGGEPLEEKGPALGAPPD